MCLRCGSGKHMGECDVRCLHCHSEEHSCTDRRCPKWKDENEICQVKAEKNVSFFQARKIWESEKKQNTAANGTGGVSFATVAQKENTTEVAKIEALETKVEKLTELVTSLVETIKKL